MAIRKDILKAANSVLATLARKFETGWDPNPITIGTLTVPERASLDYLCNLGLVISGPTSSVDYVFDGPALVAPSSQVLDMRPDLKALSLSPQVQARIVQEGAENFLKRQVEKPVLPIEIPVIAPISLAMLDQLFELAPTGDLVLLNAICYADLRHFGRDDLEFPQDVSILKRGVQACYKHAIIKVSRSCSPDEVLLVDGRATVVASLRVTRH